MRKLVLAGLVAGLSGLAIPAAHADDAGSAALTTGLMAQASAAPAVRSAPPAPRAPMTHGTWGQRVDGRWSGGARAPGGWNGYYRPVPGWSLPSYWINPDFYIADWRAYGLPAPAAGYGWSRYYDDAVLTDRYGRVADARYGYDWNRYGGYDDDYAPPPPVYREERRARTGDTVAGAVVGGVVGGIAGNAIAGRGQKTAGTVVGAGIGAIAGAAVGNAAGKPRHRRGYAAPDYYGDPYRDGPYAHGAPVPPARYDGQWEGTWYGQDGRAYSGTYDGRFQGDVRGGYYGAGTAYIPQAPLPYAPVPAYGFAAGGYASSYSAVDYVAPTIVTTTVTTEETTYAARTVRKAAVRKARPRPRTVCCPCGC